LLEVPSESAILVEPSDCPFDNPPAGHDFDALDYVGAFDDRDHPATQRLQRTFRFLASIAAISEFVPQQRKPLDYATQDDWRSVAILNVSSLETA